MKSKVLCSIGSMSRDHPQSGLFYALRQGLQLLKLFCEIPDSDARAQLIQLARHASREERPHRPA